MAFQSAGPSDKIERVSSDIEPGGRKART
jgi:hypothetical protein